MGILVNQGKKTDDILIVDDIAANLTILVQMLSQAGYGVRAVTSVKQAEQAIKQSSPHLILLDISMPEIDGFEFCEMLKKDPKTKEIPIMFISAMNSSEDKVRGFKLGAVDFITKPFELEEVTVRVNTHLKIYRMQKELELYNRKLHKIVDEQRHKIIMEHRNLIYAMAKLSEARDDMAGTHLEVVGKNARLLAMSLQLSPKFEKVITDDFVETIELAAPLHDIGKTMIPDRILLKPGRLDDEEMEIIKTHTKVGAKTLQEIRNQSEDNEFIKMAIDIVYYHHEKWDGSGYPEGIKGEEIPLSARILQVVDVYDILTKERCYKKAFTREQSMKIMKQEAGKSFDPDIIEIFGKIQKRLHH